MIFDFNRRNRHEDIEAGIRFRTNGRKVTAPQVNAEKITHRLKDGEKEESFAVRLSRAGDEENHGDKNIAKGDDRLSDGTMDEKIPLLCTSRGNFGCPNTIWT